MKKILFSLAVLFGCATVSFAQTNFVATLQHKGVFSHYYGNSALQTAYGEAENGDTITLSSGIFAFDDSFEKGITVRGVGIANPHPTVVSGEINLRSKDAKLTTTFEGIHFSWDLNIYNSDSEQGQGKIYFNKCMVYNHVYATADEAFSTEHGPLVRFTNCNINQNTFFYDNSYPYFVFANCYVFQPHCESESIGPNLTSFENCIINYRYDPTKVIGDSWYFTYAQYAFYLNFFNSIFVFDNLPNRGSDAFPSTATATNCISISERSDYRSTFANIYDSSTNKYVTGISEIFKTYVYGYWSDDYFALTDEAAATYLGTDGTQIGVQGGFCPYTPVMNYPIVTTLEAGKTSKDGILRVEVGIDEY